MATTARRSDNKYDRYKKFNGEQYTGMTVGATHKWYYDKGEWRERKQKPDDWNLYYKTTKRRAGKAPDESGVPVGTEYNWLIVSHQRVAKLDANSYMTCMEGRKFKVAHKRADKQAWNISEQGQRRKVIAFLEQLIDELKAADDDARLPWTVGSDERIYGLDLRNVNELRDMAADFGIPGRSKMKRDALLAAIKQHLYGKPRQDKASVSSINKVIRDERHRTVSKAA